MIRKVLEFFTKTELLLWLASMFLIILSFCLFDRSNPLTLIASLIGVTSIIINAKGNPLGQCLMIIFGLLYGYISYTFSYYGEMITYLGMTTPMSVVALISWLRHPFKGRKSEVTIYKIQKKEILLMLGLSLCVTVLFYFILRYFNTANLLPSTFSITTSFIAVYLTYKRSPLFSVAYAFNDVVLIILWTLAAMADPQYISVVVCFITFLLNDVYGYISWKKIEKRQASDRCAA